LVGGGFGINRDKNDITVKNLSFNGYFGLTLEKISIKYFVEAGFTPTGRNRCKNKASMMPMITFLKNFR
jgi:hypothetical protein